jgi:hypothetical protein
MSALEIARNSHLKSLLRMRKTFPLPGILLLTCSAETLNAPPVRRDRLRQLGKATPRPVKPQTPGMINGTAATWSSTHRRSLKR